MTDLKTMLIRVILIVVRLTYMAMVLFVLALVQPTLPEGHTPQHHIQPMHHLLLVSSVGSGTIAGTTSGQYH